MGENIITINELIEYLRDKINGCKKHIGLEKELAVYEQVLRKAEEIPAVPERGDLVVLSHWGDFDWPYDAVVLGRFLETRGGYYYVEGNPRGYRHYRIVYRPDQHEEEEEG